MTCPCFWSETTAIMDLVRRLLPHETTSNKYIFSSLHRRFFSIRFIWFCCSIYEFWLLDVTWFFGWSLRTSLGLRFVWYTSLRRLPSDIFLGRKLASDMNSLCLLFECCCSPCLAPNRSCWILGRVRVSLCSKPNETLFRRRFVSTFISKIDQPIAFRSTVETIIFFEKQFLSPGFVKQKHLDGNSTRHMFKVYNICHNFRIHDDVLIKNVSFQHSSV